MSTPASPTAGCRATTSPTNCSPRGLRRPNSIKTNWEINPGFGGPISQDKLWFFFSARYMEDESYVAGMFYNKNANNPNAWTYDADPSRPAFLGQHRAPEAQAAAHLAGGPEAQDRTDLESAGGATPCPSGI